MPAAVASEILRSYDQSTTDRPKRENDVSKNIIRMATEVVFGAGNNPRPDEPSGSSNAPATRSLGCRRRTESRAWTRVIEVLTITTDDVPMCQVWREIDAVTNQYGGYTNQSYFLSLGEEWVPGMWRGEA
jgi:hypothetical protein